MNFTKLVATPFHSFSKDRTRNVITANHKKALARFALALPLWLAIAPTTFAQRLTSPSKAIVLGDDAFTSWRAEEWLREHPELLGLRAEDLQHYQLHADSRSSTVSSDLQIIRIYARLGDWESTQPVASLLLNRQRGGQVLLQSRPEPLASTSSLQDSLKLPALSLQQALKLLEDSNLPGSKGTRHGKRVFQVIDGQVQKMWRIDPPLDLSGPTNPTFLVDAQSGAIEVEFDRVRFAKVRAFEHNAKVDTETGVFELKHINENATHLEGPYFRTQNCTGKAFLSPFCEFEPVLEADQNGDFFAEVPDFSQASSHTLPSDKFAEAQIYYHADKFLAWLMDFGFAGLPCHTENEGEDAIANLRANYKTFGVLSGDPSPFDNAFYGGGCENAMVFGQGTSVDFSYDGDVICHELGHGIVEQQMGVRYLGGWRVRSDARISDAGALNEAFADYFSNIYQGDPATGEYIASNWDVFEHDWIRNADNDYSCPRSIVGEYHVDSEMVSGALWELHQEIGDPLISVVLDSITMLETDATFEEFTVALHTVAKSELTTEQAKLVLEVMQTRGLDDCTRILAFEDLQRGMILVAGNQPPPAQIKVDLPESPALMTLSFEAYRAVNSAATEEGGVTPVVYLKFGSPFDFGENGDGYGEADVEIQPELENESDATIEIETPGGQSAYVALAQRNLGSMRAINFEYSFDEAPPAKDETGGTESEDGGTEDSDADEGQESDSSTETDSEGAESEGETSDSPDEGLESDSGDEVDEDPSEPEEEDGSSRDSSDPSAEGEAPGSETESESESGETNEASGDDSGCDCRQTNRRPNPTTLLLALLSCGYLFRRRSIKMTRP